MKSKFTIFSLIIAAVLSMVTVAPAYAGEDGHGASAQPDGAKGG